MLDFKIWSLDVIDERNFFFFVYSLYFYLILKKNSISNISLYKQFVEF